MSKRGYVNLFGGILSYRSKSRQENAHGNHRVKRPLAGLVLASALVATPVALTTTAKSVAQEAESVPLVGVFVALSSEDWGTHADAFVQGMSELGYVDGKNVRYEIRFGDRNPDLYQPIAQELVALAPAVIVTTSTGPVSAVSAETSNIPIVIPHAGANLFRDFVENLERPESNITGFITANISGPDEVQFAKELVPGATRIGYLIRADISSLEANKQAVLEAAAALGVTVVIGEAVEADEALPAYQAVLAQDVDIIVVSGGGMYISKLPELAEAASAAAMPTTYRQINAVPEGGLISHGRDQVTHWRESAKLVDRLLRGETPADIPITTGVPLAIKVNLPAAAELGLTIPDSILTRASEIVR